MYSHVYALFFFTLQINSVIYCQKEEPGEVIFVNILYRHGARLPIDLYQTDPYRNKSYWTGGFGQLTNTGKRQHYELGQWLRKRYDTLLTELYSPDVIYIQSTDVDRTLMSAECNLAGMFPPKGAQVWNFELPWQPIPVHTVPLELDKVLAQKATCPTYDKELEKVFTSDTKIRRLNQSYSELFRWMSENSGEKVSLKNVDWVRDTLYVESTLNLTLPQWTNTVYPFPMEEASMESFKLGTWTPKLARLKTGLLLGEMVKNMESKMNNKTTRSVHVYSAHDENIANLLNALGAFNDVIPPYASCLMLELRVDPGWSHFVTLYYRNSTTEGPYLMKVAGCSPKCPLDRFISITRSLIPTDWDCECGLQEDTRGHLTIIIVAVVIVIVIVVVVVALCTCGKKNDF